MGKQGFISFFWSSCCLVFLAILSPFFVFSTFSPPLFGWLLSPFSLTFQPHYTTSEQNSGRQLLEMEHLLKMSLIPSTRFHQSHSEQRRTMPSLVEEDRKLNLGCTMFLLKEEPNLHDHAHLHCATLSQNAAHYSKRLKRLQLIQLWNSHPNKNKNPNGQTAMVIQINKTANQSLFKM